MRIRGQVIRGKAQATPVFAPDVKLPDAVKRTLDTIRRAIRARQRLMFHYVKLDGLESDRAVEPLALAFWGGIWTFAGWCEARGTFRTFRVDRMSAVEVDSVFPVVVGRQLKDYLATLKPNG